MRFNRSECEYLRATANNKFNEVRETWVQCGQWALPHRTKWLLSQMPGARNNMHIVDPSHTLALRSYVAGFMEGNTSASRPWLRIMAQDPDQSQFPNNRAWLDHFTRRVLNCLSVSNFYHSCGMTYYDYGTFNNAGIFMDEIKDRLHFHNLVPGSYRVINNGIGEPVVLIREFTLSVKALVDTYGKRGVSGDRRWDNFSDAVKLMYEKSNYTQMIDVAQVVRENEDFDPNKPIAMMNKKWVSFTYEIGNSRNAANGTATGVMGNMMPGDPGMESRALSTFSSKRRPFILARSHSNGNFEYGEMGPTIDALGTIKSMQKKTIAQDQAIEQMLRPALQGPASLRKSYITTQPNAFIPLSNGDQKQGLRSVFEVNPAITQLFGNIQDLRQLIDKIYYADFLLYLSRNPKTRTATETNAIMQEQQLIIGPNLQSLNWSFNVPLIDFVMDFVLDNDPFLEPPPDDLAGQFLRTEFVSVFAQAQKAADLPVIERYLGMITNVGALDPSVFQKANLDKIADIYEDRLFLPPGINRPQEQVDNMRQQAQAMAQRQQMLQQTIPALAGAAKDVGLKADSFEGAPAQ